MIRRVHCVYVAPSSASKVKTRGFYLTRDDRGEQIVAGPFLSERVALKHARLLGFEA